MSERRIFLQVLGSSAAAAALGCGGGDAADGGAGGSGEGGMGQGGMGDGAGGMSSSSTGGAGGNMACGVGKLAGPPSSFMTDGLHKVKSTSFLIGHDAGGFYALTSICTHRNCNMNVDGSVTTKGITCNCHGSRFGTDGSVTQGPAGFPLVHYAISLGCDQNLYVDTSQTVSKDTRFMP